VSFGWLTSYQSKATFMYMYKYFRAIHAGSSTKLTLLELVRPGREKAKKPGRTDENLRHADAAKLEEK
jgi:hypothetical protein